LIAPLGEFPRGSFQLGDRSCEVVAPCKARKRAAQHGRWRIDAARDPGTEDATEEAARLALIQLDETGIDAGFDGALPQKIGAESVDRADKGAVEVLQSFRRYWRSQVFKVLADAQLHFTGGLMGESDSGNTVHANAIGQRLRDGLH